jgi:Rrf2 family transcriptional regulator, nitric oxide-sensitive transcriptional repressor
MQLTRFTDYGLRIMLFLSHVPEEQKIALSVLSEQLNMNHNHVNKVSQRLAALGWINSTRGKNGGISLAPEARLLHIGKIVLALEPQLEPINCHGVECPLTENCRLQGVLAEAAQAFMDVLMKYRLEDVTEQDLALIKMPGTKETCVNALAVLDE